MVAIVEQLCIKSFEVTAENGDHWKAEQGKTYTTTVPDDGADTVTVFHRFWVAVPKDHFVVREANLAANGPGKFAKEALMHWKLWRAIERTLNVIGTVLIYPGCCILDLTDRCQRKKIAAKWCETLKEPPIEPPTGFVKATRIE